MSATHLLRVEAIRELMAENGWDAVIVTGTDPHCSEYPAPRWKQVEWVSGFTGEAGDLVITMDHAGLWTDTRYFIQALDQLQGSGIELHKLRVPEQVTIPEWLAAKYPEGAVVAVDSLCQSYDAISELSAMTVVGRPDMLSGLWEGRPGIPCTPIETVGEDQVGESRADKINWLRKFLLRNECDAIFLTSLDEIAWTLNVRASDIEYNPYVISYLFVSQESVKWFVLKADAEDADSDTADSFEDIAADEIEICGYDAIASALVGTMTPQDRIFVDPSTLNYEVGSLIVETYGEENVVFGQSPVVLRKAVKNEVEISAMREAHFEDGVAMEKFLYWLEQEVSQRVVTEWEASVKLSSLRAEIPGYRGDSFENISAYGPNAALPHYCTPEIGSAEIQRHGLYLVDSGGQYLFGTTDITRTVPMGPCTPLEKEDYTLVLRGMIELAMAVFPAGTAGCQVDAVARMPLWRAHRSFGHGTGHGVGFYLGVHEGPQDIRQNFNKQPLLPGMIQSDEPGLYREGLHGIRHENVILCKESAENEFGRFLEFETLTLCHIDTDPVERELMSQEELDWLNAYNERVYETIGPALNPEMRRWLRNKTAMIL